jgi:hypothetical protein
MAWLAMSKSAKLFVEGAQNAVWISAEKCARWKSNLDSSDRRGSTK